MGRASPQDSGRIPNGQLLSLLTSSKARPPLPSPHRRTQGLYTCASGQAVSLRDASAGNVSSTTAMCVESWDWSTAWAECPSCTPIRGELPLAGSDGSLMCFPTNSSNGPPLEIRDDSRPLGRRLSLRRSLQDAPLPPCVQVRVRMSPAYRFVRMRGTGFRGLRTGL